SRKPQSIARASFTNACFISMIWSSRERNRFCSLVFRRSRGRIANPRSITSSEKNHGLRFEGILKIDLQGNRPPKAKNRQIRLLCAGQLTAPYHCLLIFARPTCLLCAPPVGVHPRMGGIIPLSHRVVAGALLGPAAHTSQQVRLTVPAWPDAIFGRSPTGSKS